MIRIDEIYNHTFWPWFRDNRPGTRVFFCDPPGNTGPDALFNMGVDSIVENDFVFMHDQEPVHLDTFEPLFNEVMFRNTDLGSRNIIDMTTDNRVNWTNSTFKDNWIRTARNATQLEFFRNNAGHYHEFKKHNEFLFKIGHVIVSERGECVEKLCEKYGWQSHYYFYHGWACLDWFRGYDRAFLIARARDRSPTKTFMSPNRIVGGQRDHRVLFLYNIFKHGLENNHISAPRVCQYEGVDIASIAQKYTRVYQDITDVFTQATLPRFFAGEDQLAMHSYQLGNFVEAQDSLVYVPTETVYFGRRTHITEKTFKAIALEMPFVLVAAAGSLSYLREYGFQTFANVFDESYDTETDDIRRIEKVTQVLKDLNNLSVAERQQIHQACLPIVEHNYRHFYSGAFADRLWTELNQMLNEFTTKGPQ